MKDFFSGNFSGPVKVALFSLRTKKILLAKICVLMIYLWTGYLILNMLLGLVSCSQPPDKPKLV